MSKKIQKRNLKKIKITKSHRLLQALCFKPSEIDIKARQVRNTLEVDISGEIGWEVDDVQINSALRADNFDDVVVRINSPGGNVWTGVAIYNRLLEIEQPVETRIMGEAASAASIIAMAGDEITINQSGSFLVHYPYVGIVGDADKLRVMAEALDEISDMMVDIYTDRTGMTDKEIRNHMRADKTMLAAEAKKLGFVDRVIKTRETSVGNKGPEIVQAGQTIMIDDNQNPQWGFPKREALKKWLEEKGEL